jgi:chromosome segregation ATPase
MFIKSRKLFIKEQNEEEIPRSVQLMDEIREFKSKKTNLENLIMNNIESDKDITKNYEDIVGENSLLSKYGSLIKLKASIKKKENKINDIGNSIDSLKEKLKLAEKISNEDEKKNQVENIKSQIDSKDESIDNVKKEIQELEENINEHEKDLQEDLNKYEAEIKEIEKDSERYV